MATAEINGPELADPPGVTVLRDVAWEVYCKLRDAGANDHIRMTYLDGELTLMSPQYRHDHRSRYLLWIVTAVARACQIPIEPSGATTFRKEQGGQGKGAGKEPDEGFYLGDDALRIQDNDDLDLAVDPPPTLAIEVDNKADSKKALATYARLGVPEVWLYGVRGRTLWFGRRAGEGYESIDRSEILPRLTPDLVLQALEARAAGMATLQWLDWLDAWARSLPEPPPAA